MVFKQLPKSKRIISMIIERVKNELAVKDVVEIKSSDIVINYDVSLSTAYEIILKLPRYILITFGNRVEVKRVRGGLIVRKVQSSENINKELEEEMKKIEEYKKALGL
jgi:hypothetical protein